MNRTPPGPPGPAPTTPWAEWLRNYKWDYWCTATFRLAQSPAGALAHWRTYLSQVQRLRDRTYGAVRPVYAAVAVERGDADQRIHIHALVGGIGAHPLLVGALERCWHHGHLLVGPYRPHLDPKGSAQSGASAYLTKHPEDVYLIGTFRQFTAKE